MSQFFVTAATGAQGGSAAHALIAKGHRVHAIVRNPDSAAAQELAKAGVKLFKGDFEDVEAMKAAAAGCEGAFINVSPVMTDMTIEQKHAANVVEACAAAGVRKVVYSTTAGVDKYESGEMKLEPQSFMAQYWDGKLASVNALKKRGSEFESWTVVTNPKTFNSFVAPLSDFLIPSLAARGSWKTAYKPDLKLDGLDPFDTGRAAAEVLVGSGFHQKTLALRGQVFVTQDVIDAMNAVLGSGTVKLETCDKDDTDGTNPAILANEASSNDEFKSAETDDMGEFSFKPNSLEDYFKREKQALLKDLKKE